MDEIDRYDLEASFYDLLYEKTDDIPLYLKFAEKAKGAILECACGTGRVAIPLAKEGYNVVGIDANEKMLEIARKKVLEEDPLLQSRIRFVKADMRSFSLDEHFALCIIPFSSFLHLLAIKDQEACLLSINRHLEIGGRLVISVFNPDLSRPQNVVRLQTVKQIGQEKIMRFYTQSFDHPNQTTSVTYFYDFVQPDGSVRRLIVPFKLRYIFYDEMRHLLERTGFEVETVYGDEQESTFQPNSPLMVFIALKKNGVNS